MTFTITCRDCKQPFFCSSKTRLICEACKARIKRAYMEEYKQNARKDGKKTVKPARKKKPAPIITDKEQHIINKRVDDLGVTVDPGRRYTPDMPEFHQIARHYYQRESINTRVLSA
jgi:hypothetical protein